MHWNSLYAVVAVSHGLAALAFLVLSMFLLRRWRHQAHAAQLRLAEVFELVVVRLPDVQQGEEI